MLITINKSADQLKHLITNTGLLTKNYLKT